MLFVLTGYFRRDAEKTRQDIHERFNEHVAQRHPRVRYGGPLYDDAGARSGVLLIVEADGFAAAEAFLRASPYRQAGLYERVGLSELRPEIGSL